MPDTDPPTLRSRAEIEARLKVERAILEALAGRPAASDFEARDFMLIRAVIKALEWVLGEHD